MGNCNASALTPLRKSSIAVQSPRLAFPNDVPSPPEPLGSDSVGERRPLGPLAASAASAIAQFDFRSARRPLVWNKWRRGRSEVTTPPAILFKTRPFTWTGRNFTNSLTLVNQFAKAHGKAECCVDLCVDVRPRCRCRSRHCEFYLELLFAFLESLKAGGNCLILFAILGAQQISRGSFERATDLGLFTVRRGPLSLVGAGRCRPGGGH